MQNFLVNLMVLLIVFVPVLGGSYWTSKIACETKAQALGYQCNYKLFQGCLLTKPDGKKVLLEQLRDMGD